MFEGGPDLLEVASLWTFYTESFRSKLLRRCFGTLQTSQKSLQKRSHPEACPSTTRRTQLATFRLAGSASKVLRALHLTPLFFSSRTEKSCLPVPSHGKPPLGAVAVVHRWICAPIAGNHCKVETKTKGRFHRIRTSLSNLECKFGWPTSHHVIPKTKCLFWEMLNRGGFQTGGFPTFLGKVQIVSRTLSGLFLIGAVNRPRKRKRTNREIPGPSPDKSEKSRKNRESPKKDEKGQKRKDKSRSGNPLA